MADKTIQYTFTLNDADLVGKITQLLTLFGKIDTSTAKLDSDINTLGRSLRDLSNSVLPSFRRAFEEVNKAQQVFLKTERDKINILKELGKQAEDTGKKIKDSLSFKGVNLSAMLQGSISALTTALPAAIGAAIGSAAAKMILKPHYVIDMKDIMFVQKYIENNLKPRLLLKPDLTSLEKDLGIKLENMGVQVGDQIKEGLKKSLEDTKIIDVLPPTDVLLGIPFGFEQVKQGIIEIRNLAVASAPVIKEAFQMAIRAIVQSFANAFATIKTLFNEIRGFVNNIFRRILPIGSMLAGIFSIYGVKRLASSFLDTAKAIEQTQLRLGLLFKDLQTGKNLFNILGQFSLKTGQALNDLTSAAETLAIVARGDADVLERLVKGAADLAATTGMTIEEVANNLVRMWEGGISAAKQFRNKGVLEILGFQKNVDIPIKEVRDKLLTAFDSASFSGNAERISNTWEAVMGRLSNLWTLFKKEVMEGGVLDFLKATFDVITDKILNLTSDTKSWGKTTKNIAQVIIDVLKLIARAVAVVLTGYRLLQITGYSVQQLFVSMAVVVSKVFNAVANTINSTLLSIVKTVRKIGESQVFQFWGITTQETLSNLHGIELQLAKMSGSTSAAIGYWEEIEKSTWNTLQNLTKQQTPLEQIDELFYEIEQRQKENLATQQALNEELKKQGEISEEMPLTGTPALRIETDKLKSALAVQEALVEEYYAQGIAGLDRYYADRRLTMKQAFEMEAQLLEQQAEGEENLEKKQEYYNKLAELHANYTKSVQDLDQQYYDKLGELQGQQTKSWWAWQNSEERSREELLLAQQQAETAAYNRRQNALELAYGNELMGHEEFLKQKADLERTYNDRMRVYEEKILNLRLQNAKNTADMMEEAFGNMYEASGKKIKAFFYLQKAAAIASTIISTYEGAQKAYTSMAGIPYVGPALGVAFAAIAIAGGLARIATISAQNLAKGGQVEGYSPTSTADNIPANLTAGEFVQPVSSVKYYGPGVMEAIRRQVIPREALGQYALRAQRGYTHFASGGLAQAKSAEPGKTELNIVNITTRDELNEWAQTKPFEEAILNVMSRQNRNVKAILNQ